MTENTQNDRRNKADDGRKMPYLGSSTPERPQRGIETLVRYRQNVRRRGRQDSAPISTNSGGM